MDPKQFREAAHSAIEESMEHQTAILKLEVDEI
jgi:hypothetical protein